MKVLLDTHALLWLAEDHPKLGKKAADLADAALAQSGLFVSAISFWEIALLDGRAGYIFLRKAEAYRKAVLALGVEELPLTGEVAIRANRLQGLHKDPADRMIIASALYLDAVLITADAEILSWKGKLKSHDARK